MGKWENGKKSEKFQKKFLFSIFGNEEAKIVSKTAGAILHPHPAP